jgi:2-polyprenyl-3-methyl-5-hydroxy-6-metoxy-1,4-benzoquinol methylase
VQSGRPRVAQTVEREDLPFWEELVRAIVPLALPLAQRVAERTALAQRGPVAILDVGGGSGIYSVVLLGVNPQATATQVDWPTVNLLAHEFTAQHGLGQPFQTIDGDFHTVDFGRSVYDLVLYSNIAHQESPAENQAVLRKCKEALKPGGTLVISDFVLEDDRTGHPFSLLFHLVMLVQTQAGAVWRQADYRTWLHEAGFQEIALEATATPWTLIYAS